MTLAARNNPHHRRRGQGGAVPSDVVCVDQTATGAGDGTSWKDAFTTFEAARVYSYANYLTIREVWLAKDQTHILDPLVNPLIIASVRGGFAGETVASRRNPWAKTIMRPSAGKWSFKYTQHWAYPQYWGDRYIDQLEFDGSSGGYAFEESYSGTGAPVFTIERIRFHHITTPSDVIRFVPFNSIAYITDVLVEDCRAQFAASFGKCFKFNRCIFRNNTFAGHTQSGISASDNPYAASTYDNVLFVNNTSVSVCGNVRGAVAVLTNMTVADNTLSGYVLSSYSSNAGPALRNTVVYNNGGLGLCARPLTQDANNLYDGTDPKFVGASDYRLQASSPCINAGGNSYVTTSTDLDGNARIVGAAVDQGAYEYQG